jgi:hypothetical protein
MSDVSDRTVAAFHGEYVESDSGHALAEIVRLGQEADRSRSSVTPGSGIRLGRTVSWAAT